MEGNTEKEDKEVQDILTAKQESMESEPSDIFDDKKDDVVVVDDDDDDDVVVNPPPEIAQKLETDDIDDDNDDDFKGDITNNMIIADDDDDTNDSPRDIDGDPMSGPKPKAENNNEVDLTEIDISPFAAKAVDDLKEVREGDKEMLAMISQDEDEDCEDEDKNKNVDELENENPDEQNLVEEEEEEEEGAKMKYEGNSDKIKAQHRKDYSEEVAEGQEEDKKESPEEVAVPKHGHPLSPLVSLCL